MTHFLRKLRARSAAAACCGTAASLVLLLVACHKTPQPTAAANDAPTSAADRSAVATVNGAPISRVEYDVYLKSLLQGKPVTDLTADQKNGILDELISMQLLSEQARKDGADQDADTKARLELVRVRILADAESQKFLKGKEPGDAELHAEYDKAVAGMDKTPKTEYHARHILVASKEQAQRDIKKINAGAKFEDVAKADSTDTSKSSGGDLGWFSADGMEKPFADAVKQLKKGAITAEPVQTKYGWHVIKLEDTRQDAPSPPPFDRVKQQVLNGMMQKQLLAHVDELKKNAKIEKTP